jgi:predicted porin
MHQTHLKKNWIGLLVLASACTYSFAEVKISGAVDQSLEWVDTKTNPTTTGKPTGTDNISRLGSTLSNYNYLSFSGKEEIGGNLSATFEMSIKDLSPVAEGVAMKGYLGHIGLEGDFGKLKIGRQWRPLFTAIAAIDPTQLAATPGFAGAGKSGTGLAGLAPEPNKSTFTYNLPSPTPGMFIQIQKGMADPASTTGLKQGENHGAYVIFTDGKKFFATYAMHSEKMTAGSATAPSVFAGSITGTNGTSATLAGQTLFGYNGLNHVLYGGTTYAGGDTRESSGIAGTYDFGSFKLVGGRVTEEVKGKEAKLVMNAIGVKIPLMAKLNLGYLYSKADHTRDPSAVNALTSSIHTSKFSISGNKSLVTYDFSKRTTLYYAYGKQQLVGDTALGNEFSSQINAIGIQHKF